jgi:hypothetical protein
MEMKHSDSYIRILNRMRYYDYQQGFIQSHINQQGGWDSHQEKCRNLILKAMDLYKPKRVTAYGSGWLLELPLAEMVENTDEIVLVDIIHPPDVYCQTEGMKKVRLVEDDVTGGLIEEVWKIAGKRTFLNKLPSLDQITIPDYKPAEDPGLVLSLNLLTQLEYLPLKLLKAKSKATEAEFEHFREEVQKSHMRFLSKHNSLLITDVETIYTDVKGNMSGKKTVFAEIPPGKVSEEWVWDFDLKYSDYNRKNSVLKIKAVIF